MTRERAAGDRGAHSADFVWRAGGAIAVATSGGGTAQVLALTYGERGESGELWKEQGKTVERVKEIRRGEAERAAARLGASFESLDLGDYPLEIDSDGLIAIADRDPRVRAGRAPHAHRPRPVQPGPRRGVLRRREGARARRRRRVPRAPSGPVPAAGAPALRAAPARALQLHPDRLRRHHAGDRAEAGGDGRDEGAGATCTPTTTSAREQRGNHARRSSGNDAIQFAEAFQRVTPQVVDAL